MRTPDINLAIALVAAGFYTVLLVVAYARRNRQERISRLLLAFLALSIIGELLYFLTVNVIYPSNMPALGLIVNTVVLGAMTTAYAGWAVRRRWFLTGLIVVAVVLAVNVFLPAYVIAIPNTDLPRVRDGFLVAVIGWAGLSGYMLVQTWRDFKRTLFPWHANRLLYWTIALLITFVGEGLLFWRSPGPVLLGQIIRLTGVAFLTSAVLSHRIFDVRTRAQRVVAFIIITIVSALPLVAAFLVTSEITQRLALPVGASAVVLVSAIAVALLLYQPFRRAVERFTFRYLQGEGLETNKVLRGYSQAISRTLDVQQLSLLIISTLHELLETNRGALMLITRTRRGYEIDPIPAMGRISQRTFTAPPDSLFIAELADQHQPLLQYEIDFNPDYAGVTSEERAWLREQAMDVYVPVSSGELMVGLIALGPKASGVPYQPGELELAQVLADQTVVALENARLFSELGMQNERIRDLNVDLVGKNERLEIMDRVKSDFITIASHELRTPLTQVKGYADILAAMNEENALTREQTREIIGHVNRATLQLESLVTAMLDASQLDVEGMQLTFVETKLETVFKLASEPLIRAMRERRITYEVDGLRELPTIYADFKRLVQAFANVLGNAVKYTPDHGRIHVQASLIPSQDNMGDFVEIVISDTGIGIDSQFHELIFEKFFRVGDPQLHSTGNTKFKGAGPGLGLPITRGVIEAHTGRIWVESEGEDEARCPGSRFHILLPVEPPGATEVTTGPLPRPSYAAS